MSKATKLPVYHLDMIWHKPDKTTISRADFDTRLSEIINQDQWIIDGNYQRTLALRLAACDTVVLLDYPIDVCLAGAAARVGATRADMPWLETELDSDFKQSIVDFANNNLPQIYALLDAYAKNKNVLVFKSREEANHYVAQL